MGFGDKGLGSRKICDETLPSASIAARVLSCLEYDTQFVAKSGRRETDHPKWFVSARLGGPYNKT